MTAGMERVDPLLDSRISTFSAVAKKEDVSVGIQTEIRERFRGTTPACRGNSGCAESGRDTRSGREVRALIARAIPRTTPRSSCRSLSAAGLPVS